MLYYIDLDGHEFPLTSTERSEGGRTRLAGAAGELELEVLFHTEQGRPGVILVDGTVHRVWTAPRANSVTLRRAPDARRAIINGRPVQVKLETELERRARPNRNTAAAAGSRVLSPMPGRVVKIDVRPGDVVAAGAPLLGIEAMKMENELLAPNAGRIARVAVQVGATVDADQELIVIEPV
jgi:biotin carboxyl carrier protein